MSAGYLLVPVLVLVVTVEGTRRADGASSGAEALVTFTGSTVTLVVALSFVYAPPSALAAVRRTGRLRSAVDVDAVGPVLREVDYLFG